MKLSPDLLGVDGSIAGQLEELSSQALHDGGQVDCHTNSNLIKIDFVAKKIADTSNKELKSSIAGMGLGLAPGLSSLPSSRHDD